MDKPKIIIPAIEDLNRIFIAMSEQMLINRISCSLIAIATPEHQALISAGDQSLIAGALVAQLKHTLSRCNREVNDLTKGLILKEIFNQ